MQKLYGGANEIMKDLITLRLLTSEEKLAIAEPVSAPYLVEAFDKMRKLGVNNRLAPNLVQGASIAQT